MFNIFLKMSLLPSKRQQYYSEKETYFPYADFHSIFIDCGLHTLKQDAHNSDVTVLHREKLTTHQTHCCLKLRTKFISSVTQGGKPHLES